MLPFLKNKNDRSVGGLIVKTRAPDSDVSDEPKEESGDSAIEACANDLINAFHSRDVKAAAAAMKAAHAILDSQTQDDGSYDAQNRLAAQDDR